MKQGKRQRSEDSSQRWGDAAGRYPLLTAAEEVHLGQMIRAWQDHPDGPDGAPAGVRRRGIKARDRMVLGNLRLVMKVAGRRQRTGAGEDYLQAGAEGLVKAAERFDPARGYKFSTYAYWWILQSMGHLQEHAGLVYVAACTLANIRKGVHAPDSEVARSAQLALQGTSSLDFVAQDEDGDCSSVGDLVPALLPDPLHAAAAVEALEAFREAGGEDAALLELQRVDRANVRELAELEGASYASMQKRLQTARQQLRQVAGVRELLAS